MRRFILVMLYAVALASCTYATVSHNAKGGYIPACGDLPGMVGDDC